MANFEVITKKDGTNSSNNTLMSSQGDKSSFEINTTKNGLTAVETAQNKAMLSAAYVENGKLKIDKNQIAQSKGFSSNAELEAFKTNKPVLYEAMGGVNYFPQSAPVTDTNKIKLSNEAVNKIVGRYINTDTSEIDDIVKTLGSGEWQDADTMKKYSDKITTYANDYIALDSIGYFNSLSEEQRKNNVDSLKGLKKMVNSSKDAFSKYVNSNDFNKAVWNDKYSSMTWAELEDTEQKIKDELLKKTDEGSNGSSLQELQYIKRIMANQNKDVWDRTVSFKKLSVDEQNKVLSDIIYGAERYDDAEEYIDILNKSAENLEDIDGYIAFVKDWYNKNGTTVGAREAYGIRQGYTDNKGRYSRENEKNSQMLDYADTMAFYETKYGNKANLDKLAERLIEYHENDAANEEFTKYYTEVESDPNAAKYIEHGKKIYKTKNQNISEEEYNVCCYYLGKGEKDNYYFTWLKDVVYKREVAASGGWASVYDGESLKYHKLWSDYTKNAPLEANAMSVALNLGSGVEFVYNTLDGNVEEIKLSKASSKIREAYSNTRDWIVLGFDAHDFLYNTTMSGMDSLVAMGFGKAGSYILGLSAAAAGVNDALNRGLSDEQAFWNGLMSGVFECFFEKYSIEQLELFQASMGAGWKTIAKNLGKTMLTNASEEALTEIANIAYDIFLNGDLSHYQLMLQKYMDSGLSDKEARLKAALQLGGQIAEATASGALMGLGFGFIGNTSAARNASLYGKYYYGSSQKSVDALVDNGLVMPEGSEAYKLAVKADARLKSGKNLSGTTLYNLAIAIESEIESKGILCFNELGVDKKTAKELAPVVAKAVFGEKLSSVEHAVLNNSEIAVQVAKELSADRANTVWKDAIKNSRINNVSDSNSVTEQGEVLQSTADGVVDSVNDFNYNDNSMKEGESYNGENTELLERGAVSAANRGNNALWQPGTNSGALAACLGVSQRSDETYIQTIRAGECGWLDGKSNSASEETWKSFKESVFRKIRGVELSGKDTIGGTVSTEILERFKNTICKDEEGNLVSLYHWTTEKFETFRKGEFGFHFGTLRAAYDRYLQAKEDDPNVSRGIYKEVILNITNPIEINDENGIWTVDWVAFQLLQKGIIGEQQYGALSNIDGFYDNTYDNPAAKAVREILAQNGYDGIIYENLSEDVGSYSLIALYPEQIITVAENGVLKENSGISRASSEDEVAFSVPMVEQQISIEKYSEEQYNSFGWVRYNDILSVKEYNILLSRYADYKHNKNQYPTTRFGEAVIHSSECPDVLMYVKGEIRNPQITKVVRINIDEYNASVIKEEILHYEYRQIPLPYKDVEIVYGEGILDINKKQDCISFRGYRAEQERRTSATNSNNNRAEQDGRGSVEKNTKVSRADSVSESALFLPIEKRGDISSPISKHQCEFVQEICNKLGRIVVFEDLRDMVYKGKIISPDGYIDAEGIIHLNTYAENPIGFVFKHELTHYAEKAKGYKKFVKSIKNSSLYDAWIKSKANKEYLWDAEDAYRQMVYRSQNGFESIEDVRIDNEIIADFVGDMLFTDGGSGLLSIAAETDTKQRNFIVQWVIDFISFIKRILGGQKTHLALELSVLEDGFRCLLNETESNNFQQHIDDVRFCFIRCVDSDVINEAEDMEKCGAKQYQIWDKLKVIRNGWGDWLSEVDMRNFAFFAKGTALVERGQTNPNIKLDGNIIEGKLGDFVRFKSLFKIYPQLKDVNVVIKYASTDYDTAKYLIDSNKLIIDKKLYDSFVNEKNQDIKAHIIREIQRMVQRIEGRSIDGRLKNIERIRHNGFPMSLTEDRMLTEGEMRDSFADMYEARAVEKRQIMKNLIKNDFRENQHTLEKQVMYSPYFNYDQILLFDDNGNLVTAKEYDILSESHKLDSYPSLIYNSKIDTHSLLDKKSYIKPYEIKDDAEQELQRKNAQDNSEKMEYYVLDLSYQKRSRRVKTDNRIRAGNSGCLENNGQPVKQRYKTVTSLLNKNVVVEPSGTDTAGRRHYDGLIRQIGDTSFKDKDGNILSLYIWNNTPVNIQKVIKYGIEFTTFNGVLNQFLEEKQIRPYRYNGMFQEFYLNSVSPLVLDMNGWNTIDVARWLLRENMISQSFFDELMRRKTATQTNFNNGTVQLLLDKIKLLGYDSIVFVKDLGDCGVMVFEEQQIIPVAQKGIICNEEYIAQNDENVDCEKDICNVKFVSIDEQGENKIHLKEVKNKLSNCTDNTQKLTVLTEILTGANRSIPQKANSLLVGSSGIMENTNGDVWEAFSKYELLKTRATLPIADYDNAGRYVDGEHKQNNAATIFKDNDGRLLSLFAYKGRYAHDQFGIQLGTLESARDIYNAEKERHPAIMNNNFLEYYVNMKNPYFFISNAVDITPAALAKSLFAEGKISFDEYSQLLATNGCKTTSSKSQAAAYLRRIIWSRGIDGVVYWNNKYDIGSMGVIALYPRQLTLVSKNGAIVNNEISNDADSDNEPAFFMPENDGEDTENLVEKSGKNKFDNEENSEYNEKVEVGLSKFEKSK